MKINLYLAALMALMASCTGNGSSKSNDTSNTTISPGDTQLASAPGSPAVNMQYCFFHTDGTQAQDTTKVSLLINGDSVTGNMQWLPKEKDTRKGTLTGTLNGNAIKALWTFNQEGKPDTMTVEFQLRGNALAQKAYKYNPKTGREQTNPVSDYKVVYNMTNCK